MCVTSRSLNAADQEQSRPDDSGQRLRRSAMRPAPIKTMNATVTIKITNVGVLIVRHLQKFGCHRPRARPHRRLWSALVAATLGNKAGDDHGDEYGRNHDDYECRGAHCALPQDVWMLLTKSKAAPTAPVTSASPAGPAPRKPCTTPAIMNATPHCRPLVIKAFRLNNLMPASITQNHAATMRPRSRPPRRCMWRWKTS